MRLDSMWENSFKLTKKEADSTLQKQLRVRTTSMT